MSVPLIPDPGSRAGVRPPSALGAAQFTNVITSFIKDSTTYYVCLQVPHVSPKYLIHAIQTSVTEWHTYPGTALYPDVTLRRAC